MIRCWPAAAALMFGALLLPAQAPQAPQTTTPTDARKPAPPSVVVTDYDNGKDIDLPPNQILIVKLSSTPSTGYNWTVVGDPAPLKLQKTSYRKNSTAQVAGAPGVQTFQFTAGSAGIANLSLAYRRSWEYNQPPAKTFTLRVSVR